MKPIGHYPHTPLKVEEPEELLRMPSIEAPDLNRFHLSYNEKLGIESAYSPQEKSEGETGKFIFGAHLLITSGIISPSLMEKFYELYSPPETSRMIRAIEMDDLQLAGDIGLESSFINANPRFVNSGLAPLKAVEKGHFEYARDLMRHTYQISNRVVYEALKSNNITLARWAVEGGYYGDETLELDLWYLISLGILDAAEMLIFKEERLKRLCRGYSVDTIENARKLMNYEFLMIAACKNALEVGYDEIACKILCANPSMISSDMIDMAIQSGCIDFLKRLWTGETRIEPIEAVNKRRSRSEMWDKLASEAQNDANALKLIENKLKLTYILDNLLLNSKSSSAEKLLKWPEAMDQSSCMEILIKHKQEDLAISIIESYSSHITVDDMNLAFKEGLFNLCVALLSLDEINLALHCPKIQEQLIKLLEKGETCRQAMEMLNQISTKHWHLELTNELCSVLATFAKKRYEIVICSAPLLFCVLTAEFLNRISEASLQHQNSCTETAEVYIYLAKAIQDAIKEEHALKYFLEHQDATGRTVLTILSENEFYTLLENDEIGTIVTKMWIGSKRNYGLVGASSLYKSFYSPAGSQESMQFSKSIDLRKPYMFHYEQWTESCSLRFMAQGLSTIVLVVLYQLVFYFAIHSDSMYDATDNYESMILLRISQAWIFSIAIEQVVHIIYAVKTGRDYEFDNWRVLDLIMLAVTIVIMSNPQEEMGDGKDWDDADPELFNTALHSIIMVIIWVRFLSVLITNRRFGPLLKMIYLMAGEVISFFAIFICLGICSAAVFTALFNDAGDYFVNFSTTVRTLYSAALANYDLTVFTKNIALGGVIYGAYLLIANIMFLNLLIAILSNVYSELNSRVDAEHRSMVITYYNRWFWDDRYGILILLPPPLTFLSLLLSPIFLFMKDTRSLNNFLCKVFYIFYAIPQYLIYLVVNILYFPLMYFKGFVIFGKTGIRKVKRNEQQIFEIKPDDDIYNNQSSLTHEVKIETTGFNIWRSLLWTFIGIPWLLWALLRDNFHFWMIMYRNIEHTLEETEKPKAQQLVTEEFMKDVQIVLEGILANEISVQQIVDIWSMFDQIHSSDEDSADFQARKNLATEYFTQFANSPNDPVIDVERMRRLLPKSERKYDEEYLIKAQHICVPWLLKAAKRYQQTVGSVSIGGISIPKQLSQASYSITSEQIDTLERSIHELESKYDMILSKSRSIKSSMESQTELLSAGGGQRS